MQKAVILKKASETKAEFGEVPEKRSIQRLLDFGVVNIDKPEGPTSHQVSDYVQRILNITKAGHSGTLDPQVTGVQPIAIGRATRITQFLLTAPKEYVGIMHLHKDLEEAIFRDTIKKFIGKIKQLNQFNPSHSWLGFLYRVVQKGILNTIWISLLTGYGRQQRQKE